MAVGGITFSNNASRHLNYLLGGEAHDGSGRRRYVHAEGFRGVFPQTAAQQFAVIRGIHGQRDIKRQSASVYLSFTEDELAPDDPLAGEKALAIGGETVQRAFPGHPGIVVVQNDGYSGLWHVHASVSGVSDRDAELVYRRKPRKSSIRDKIAAKDSPDGLIEVREQRPAGRAFSSAMGNKFRLAHVTDEVLADAEFMRSIGMGPYDNAKFVKSRSRTAAAKQITTAEKQEHSAGNDWRQQMRDAIEYAQQRATSIEDFRDLLSTQRVLLKTRRNRPDGQFSYEMVDANGKRRHARAGGRDGIGATYTRSATEKAITNNEAAHRHAAPQAGMEPAVETAQPNMLDIPPTEQEAEDFEEIAAHFRRRRAARKEAAKRKTPAHARYLARRSWQPAKHYDREYGG